jgi:Domain of unknown function (DUF4266)
MNAHTFRSTAALLLTAVSIGVLGGCNNSKLVRVKPWERAHLADYMMRPDRDPLETANAEHVYSSRESAIGGREVGGSGCGCN